MHHPVADPSPTGASQLTDRKEASLLSGWLTDFERTSGKQAASIASHAGLFTLSRVDGVPYLINGNSGKTPAAAPGDGGFVGWTSVRFDPSGAVRFETHPNVDALTVTGPAELTRGAAADVRAVLTQAGRQVPVSYPVSANWTAGWGTHIVEGLIPALPGDVASFDPSTGVLTALRPGAARLTVTVNGVSRTLTVTIR
jgi:hypothetical protein